MHKLCKIGMVCHRVADPHLIFDRICVFTIQTHMRRLLLGDLALTSKKLLSLCTIPFPPTLLSGGDMYNISTPGSTIDPAKQWVTVLNTMVIIVNNCPPPPLCTPYHEPMACVI